MSFSINQNTSRAIGATAVQLLACLLAANASAHINLTSHVARDGESDIKDAPCGRAGSTRGNEVYTYKPGATINITLDETISHPGYFRIAFDQDGQDGFAVPVGISGEGGDCAGDAKCGPGMEDFCNNETVLLDNLDQHTGSFLGPTVSYTWSVTLPNVECQNCTLQVIQVMADLNVHRAAYPSDDIYYQCIDLVLSPDAEDVTDAPVTNNGMDCKAGEPQAGAGGSMAGDGGTGGAAGTMMAGMGGSGATSGTSGTVAGTGGAAGTTTAGTGGAAGAGAASGGVGGMPGMGGASAGMSMTAGAASLPTAGTMGAAGAAASDDDDESSSGCAAGGARPSEPTLLLASLSLVLAALSRRRLRA